MEVLNYLSLIKRFNVQRTNSYRSLVKPLKFDLKISINSLKSLEDTQLMDILDFLELISGQKPVILKATGRYIGSTKKFFVSCGVNLSKSTLHNFLLYVSLCAFPAYIRRYGRFYKRKDVSSYVFCFKDFFLFPNFKGKPFVGNILLKISGDPTLLVDYLLYWKFPLHFNKF